MCYQFSSTSARQNNGCIKNTATGSTSMWASCVTNKFIAGKKESNLFFLNALGNILHPHNHTAATPRGNYSGRYHPTKSIRQSTLLTPLRHG